jgi:hypothetical protein
MKPFVLITDEANHGHVIIFFILFALYVSSIVCIRRIDIEKRCRHRHIGMAFTLCKKERNLIHCFGVTQKCQHKE